MNREQHDPTQCPLRESLYCSLCSTYGHHTNMCPDKMGWQTRVPEFQEQLIPLNIRNLYGISSMTPLAASPSPSPSPLSGDIPQTAVFEVYDNTPKSIRAALTALGVQSKTDHENKRTLERLVLAQGKKLVYSQDEASRKSKKEKRSIKIGKKVAEKSGLCDTAAPIPSEDVA